MVYPALWYGTQVVEMYASARDARSASTAHKNLGVVQHLSAWLLRAVSCTALNVPFNTVVAPNNVKRVT